MTKEQLEAIFDRVRTWPAERQEDAAQVLLAMEEAGTDIYVLSPEERAGLEEGLAEFERGDVASDEEVAAVFSRYKVDRAK